MKVLTILGTRPEIIKLSSLVPLLNKRCDHLLLHTGQHYSFQMDKVFFKELNLRKPDYLLEVGSGTHAYQAGTMMMGIERIIRKTGSEVVIVQGDTNSTLAGALAASKLGVRLIHIESGCRSFNRHAPEEINRVLVDHCADLLFTPDKITYENLLREGIDSQRIRMVGDTSIDAVLRNKALAQKSRILEKLALLPGKYLLLTLHRAETTDEIIVLKDIFRAINDLATLTPIVFPIHPRTQGALKKVGISLAPQIKLIAPLGYIDFLKLMSEANFILTDSGGIQTEGALLNVPCLILRKETEWKELVNVGKNLLIGVSYQSIISKVKELLQDRTELERFRSIPCPLSGGATKRILNILIKEVFKNG